MIPQIIHCCWFGHNPKPVLAKKCMKSWKKYCPNYRIIEWNEDNYDIASAPLYVRQAYEAKKWAFVTDYVRLDVVYQNGGIYLDTDVELIKPLDHLLKYPAFFGFQNDAEIATGLGFGASRSASILKELMDDYKDIPFYLGNGEYDLTACPERNTIVFIRHGLKQNNSLQVLDDDTMIFPTDFFSPKSLIDGRILKRRTTISIHHFDASWYSEEQRGDRDRMWRKNRISAKINRFKDLVKKVIGQNRYDSLKELLKIQRMN